MSTEITDPEVKVMQQVCETLEALSPEARRRVLAKVAEQFGTEAQPLGDPHSHRHPRWDGDN